MYFLTLSHFEVLSELYAGCSRMRTTCLLTVVPVCCRGRLSGQWPFMGVSGQMGGGGLVGGMRSGQRGGGGGLVTEEGGGWPLTTSTLWPDHLPRPQVKVTHICENITFARFATRAVTTGNFWIRDRHNWKHYLPTTSLASDEATCKFQHLVFRFGHKLLIAKKVNNS